jgi:hypothetical protein
VRNLNACKWKRERFRANCLESGGQLARPYFLERYRETGVRVLGWVLFRSSVARQTGFWDWGTMIKPLRLLSVPCSMIHLSFMDPSSCSTSNRIFADGRL